MNNYRNDVNKDYDKCEFLEKIMLIIFLIILPLSIINVYATNRYITFLIVILNIGYIFISFINDMFFINTAESERRKTNISNAFEINITSKKTNKFYNNQFEPSIKKLGVNCFESTLYTKNTLSKMLILNGIKTFVLCFMWIMIIFQVSNINIFQIMTELFFSAEIFLKLIKNIYYYFTAKKIYDSFYYQFITKRYDEKQDLPIILQHILEYECLKSYCHFLLSERIFKKDKLILEREWNDIVKEIR